MKAYQAKQTYLMKGKRVNETAAILVAFSDSIKGAI